MIPLWIWLDGEFSGGGEYPKQERVIIRNNVGCWLCLSILCALHQSLLTHLSHRPPIDHTLEWDLEYRTTISPGWRHLVSLSVMAMSWGEIAFGAGLPSCFSAPSRLALKTGLPEWSRVNDATNRAVKCKSNRGSHLCKCTSHSIDRGEKKILTLDWRWKAEPQMALCDPKGFQIKTSERRALSSNSLWKMKCLLFSVTQLSSN